MVQIYSKTSTKADASLAKDQLYVLKSMYETHGREYFCKNMIWILRKKPEKGDILPTGAWNRRLIPYKMNAMQRDLNQKQSKKNIVLKQRQGGITTDRVLNRLLIPCVLNPGSAGLLISQTHGYAAQHFVILHRAVKYFGKVEPFNDNHPANKVWRDLRDHLLHIQYSPRKELVFDMLDSRILANSAEVTEVGQGLPGISHLVCSEVARWPHAPEETMANVKESVHDDGTVDLESTANGIGGYFHEEYQRAKNEGDAEFLAFFYQWWWSEEYRKEPALDKKTLSEEERELKKQWDLDLEQLAWRRGKKIALRREFDEKYPENDVKCFLTSGHKFFDSEVLYMRLLQLTHVKPFAEEELPGEARNDAGVLKSYIRIYKRKVAGRRYIGFGDMARGIEVTGTDTDFCAATFIDEETGEDVAGIRARLDPYDFGKVMVMIAKMFNNAVLCVERTGDGHSCMLAFRDEGYTNIYEHDEWDKDNRQMMKIQGWPATTVTRPIALNRLSKYIKEYPHLLHDKQFLEEAMTFIRNSKTGKPAAAVGHHDDTVTAHYGAHYVRLVQLGFLDPIGTRREAYGEQDVA